MNFAHLPSNSDWPCILRKSGSKFHSDANILGIYKYKSPNYFGYYHRHYFCICYNYSNYCSKITVITIIVSLSLLFFVELMRSAMWTLDLCEFVLPGLKGLFYSPFALFLFFYFIFFIQMNCILIGLLKRRASSKSSFFITISKNNFAFREIVLTWNKWILGFAIVIEVLLIVSRMENVSERNSMFKFRILHSRKKISKRLSICWIWFRFNENLCSYLVKTTYSTLVSIEHVTKTKGKYLERIFQFLRQSFKVICLGSMKISVSKSLCYVRRDESPT